MAELILSSSVPLKRGPLENLAQSSPPEGQSQKKYLRKEASAVQSRDKYACPFAKRNPKSAFRSCWTGWTSMARVKEHLQRRHRRPAPCQDCNKSYEQSNIAGQHHQHQSEHDDRWLSEEASRSLSQRTKKSDDAIEAWRQTFRSLFPRTDDKDIPWPFYTNDHHAEDLHQFIHLIGDRLHQWLQDNEIFTEVLPLSDIRSKFMEFLNDTLEDYHARYSQSWESSLGTFDDSDMVVAPKVPDAGRSLCEENKPEKEIVSLQYPDPYSCARIDEPLYSTSGIENWSLGPWSLYNLGTWDFIPNINEKALPLDPYTFDVGPDLLPYNGLNPSQHIICDVPLVQSPKYFSGETTDVTSIKNRNNISSASKQSYFCTFCIEQGSTKIMRTKQDWKRHEEDYHTGSGHLWFCEINGCNAFFSRGVEFRRHVKDTHVDYSRSLNRQTKSSEGRNFGCGFRSCSKRFDDWKDRCDHVAACMKTETPSEWSFTRTIENMLRHSTVYDEWTKLVKKKERQIEWSAEATCKMRDELSKLEFPDGLNNFLRRLLFLDTTAKPPQNDLRPLLSEPSGYDSLYSVTKDVWPTMTADEFCFEEAWMYSG